MTTMLYENKKVLILLSPFNKRCQLVLLIETRREIKLKEGDMWVYSIAVYGFFSFGILVILILTCGIAVWSSSAVCGFHFGHHLSDGIQWTNIVHSITVLFISAFLSIQYAKKRQHGHHWLCGNFLWTGRRRCILSQQE